MYLCNRCGRTFDFPDSVVDFRSEMWGRRVGHYVSVCPYCQDDDFDEMDRCEICGEYIPPGEEICDNCHELISDYRDIITGRIRELSITHKLNYDELIEHLKEEL